MRPQNLEVPRHSRYYTVKIYPCLKTVSADFAASHRHLWHIDRSEKFSRRTLSNIHVQHMLNSYIRNPFFLDLLQIIQNMGVFSFVLHIMVQNSENIYLFVTTFGGRLAECKRLITLRTVLCCGPDAVPRAKCHRVRKSVEKIERVVSMFQLSCLIG